jgi:hypothetical protein
LTTAETKGDLMELNDHRSGISHTTEHSAIQEAVSFKYCLMKGEEIKVESKMAGDMARKYAACPLASYCRIAIFPIVAPP